jgi:hypothetical protein
MSFKQNWKTKHHYCHSCGEVFEEHEGRIIQLRDKGPQLFLCKEHYHRIPKHIPIEQERRWYDGIRKKCIQSDGEKR